MHFAKHTKYASKHAKLNEVEPAKHPFFMHHFFDASTRSLVAD
jgi:hypothetical protein